MNEFVSIAPSVRLGKDVRLSKFINLYGCEIGDETKIGAFVEIQKNASVGKRCVSDIWLVSDVGQPSCETQSHTTAWLLVTTGRSSCCSSSSITLNTEMFAQLTK